MPILKDLFVATPVEDILSALKEHRLQEDAVGKYAELCTKLAAMKPEKSNLLLVVAKQRNCFESTNEDEYYNSVLGIDTDRRIAFDILALPRAQWLGMPVCENSLKEFGTTRFLAEVVWEMTLIHFNEADVKKEFREMEEQSEKIKRGEIETIPAEEAFRALREKYGFNAPPEKTPEEKEAQQKHILECMEWNDNEIRRLTGVDIFPSGLGKPLTTT